MIDTVVNDVPKHRLIEFDTPVCPLLQKRALGIDQLFAASNLTRCPIRKV